MKSLLSIVAVGLVLSVYCFTWTEALDCYVCAHAEGEKDVEDQLKQALEGTNVDVHKSCKSGKKPKKDYIKTCDEKLFGKNPACGKLYVEVDKIKFTMRACSPLSLNDTCHEGTIQELVDKYSTLLPPGVVIPPFPGEGSAAICSCSDDECNSSSMLQINHALWILPLTFLASKFAGIL